MRPMSARVDDALAQPRFLVQTLGFLGTLALLLASLAVFALVSHDALRRRREIGIRMAIGASSADVLRLFLGNAARLLAAGLAIGLAAALALGRLLRPALHGTPPDDPASLGAAAVLLTVVALAAAAIPAWRALRSDPLESLRND
jgi:ABC-type antimicrobial peptide transport system permease subunit